MKVIYFFLLFAILILLIGLFKSENKFQFVKAAIIFAVQLIFSTINFIIFFYVSYLLLRGKSYVDLGNLFFLFAIFVVISGILLFWGMLLAAKVIKFSATTLTLIEYYIQWSLIYVTVYQAIFSNIKKIKSIGEFIKIGNFLDPNLFIVLVLPSFISAWIAVVLYKKHIKAI